VFLIDEANNAKYAKIKIASEQLIARMAKVPLQVQRNVPGAVNLFFAKEGIEVALDRDVTLEVMLYKHGTRKNELGSAVIEGVNLILEDGEVVEVDFAVEATKVTFDVEEYVDVIEETQTVHKRVKEIALVVETLPNVEGRKVEAMMSLDVIAIMKDRTTGVEMGRAQRMMMEVPNVRENFQEISRQEVMLGMEALEISKGFIEGEEVLLVLKDNPLNIEEQILEILDYESIALIDRIAIAKGTEAIAALTGAKEMMEVGNQIISKEQLDGGMAILSEQGVTYYMMEVEEAIRVAHNGKIMEVTEHDVIMRGPKMKLEGPMAIRTSMIATEMKDLIMGGMALKDVVAVQEGTEALEGVEAIAGPEIMVALLVDGEKAMLSAVNMEVALKGPGPYSEWFNSEEWFNEGEWFNSEEWFNDAIEGDPGAIGGMMLKSIPMVDEAGMALEGEALAARLEALEIVEGSTDVAMAIMDDKTLRIYAIDAVEGGEEVAKVTFDTAIKSAILNSKGTIADIKVLLADGRLVMLEGKIIAKEGSTRSSAILTKDYLVILGTRIAINPTAAPMAICDESLILDDFDICAMGKDGFIEVVRMVEPVEVGMGTILGYNSAGEYPNYKPACLGAAAAHATTLIKNNVIQMYEMSNFFTQCIRK